MKRRRTNIGAKEKSEEQKNSYQEIFKRRSLEIFEIVCEENAIYQRQKQQEINAVDTAYGENCPSSESEDLDDEDENNFRKFRFKEKQKVIAKCKKICRNKAKSALSVLDNSIKRSKAKLTNERKRLDVLEKFCSKNDSHLHSQGHEQTWDSSMYIIKAIRACILTRNWNNLTCLLLMLLTYKSGYVSYVKQVAILNLMNNPLDHDGDILEELHKLCMASTHK